MQFNLFPIKSDWKMPEELPDLGGTFALDLETKDPYLKTKAPGYVKEGMGYIAGISVANDNFKAYFPIRHAEEENMPVGKVMRWLAQEFKKPGKKIFANAPYDIGWLNAEKIEVNWEEVHDVLTMAPLLDEHRYQYNLDALAKDYLGIGKDEDMLKQAVKQYGFKSKTNSDIKSVMWRLPAKYVGPYAEQDAYITWELHKIFAPKIVEEELERVYELESKIQPILLQMKMHGVRVDVEKAKLLKEEYQTKEREAIKKLREITGLKIDPYSTPSCAIALDKFGIEYPRTEAGNASVTADFLETVDHEIGQLIRDARRYQKAWSTFIQNFILDRHIDGRIHASFNPLSSDEGGTCSGRFSSSGPNLQQIPARDPEIGPAIRSLFIPDEGEIWCSSDYANQEPRIAAHWAYICRKAGNMKGVEEVIERYKKDNTISYHKIIQEIIGDNIPNHMDPYKTAKTINLGLSYGMGGVSLCKRLGLPTEFVTNERTGKTYEIPGEEGKNILNIYHSKVGYVKALAELCEKRAKRRGYIKTFTGRRSRVKFDGEERKAANRLIQGTAADQAKYAMIALYENGHKMLIQVHDEICCSIKQKDEAKQIKYLMENSLPMEVPFVCDVDLGPSWGEAKEVKFED